MNYFGDSEWLISTIYLLLVPVPVAFVLAVLQHLKVYKVAVAEGSALGGTVR